MKKIYSLFVLMLSAIIIASAQSNFKSGYVLTLKGDTIKGFIDYQEWDVTPLTINFKKALADKSTIVYGPADISYFNVNGIEEYQKYEGAVSTDPTSTYKVATGRDTSFKVESVFIKVLQKGDHVALYEFKDDIKARYFLSESPGFEPKELVFRVYQDPNYATNIDPNASKTITEFTYRKQLSAAALKFNELNDKLISFIGTSEYSADNILGIVSRINHFKKAGAKEPGYKGAIFNLFVGAGAYFNTTNPGQSGGLIAAGGTSNTSALPRFSAGINLFANPATRQLQFRLELGDASAKYQSIFTSKVSPYVPFEVSFNESAISVSPQIIYNFYNTDNFKVFFGFGFVYSHFSYSNAYYGGQDRSNAAAAAVAASSPFVFENTDNAFILRAGVQFSKHFMIIGSYQTTSNNTNGGYFILSSTATELGVNYIF